MKKSMRWAAAAALAVAAGCSSITVNVTPGEGTNGMASAEQSSSAVTSNAVNRTTARTTGSAAVTVNMNTYKNITPVTDLTIPLK